jgi:hypothetical protein
LSWINPAARRQAQGARGEEPKMIQSVIGPVGGVYVAMFACPVGELGDRYVGCYKLFEARPACYCDAGHVGHGETPSLHPSPDAALHGAALAAQRQIRGSARGWAQGPRPREVTRCSCCG